LKKKKKTVSNTSLKLCGWL